VPVSVSELGPARPTRPWWGPLRRVLRRNATTGPPIWPVSLLARRAPSDQRRCAGRRFQTLLRLMLQMVLKDRAIPSPSLLRGSHTAACQPPGWIDSLQSWSVGARWSIPDEPLAWILPSILPPRNRNRRDLDISSLVKSSSLADNDGVVCGRNLGETGILMRCNASRTESLYSSSHR
jgi:hypothetical protein